MTYEAKKEIYNLLGIMARGLFYDAVVEPSPEKSKSFVQYFELRGNPDYWENWSVAHYLGLKTVRMSASPIKVAQKLMNSKRRKAVFMTGQARTQSFTVRIIT